MPRVIGVVMHHCIALTGFLAITLDRIEIFKCGLFHCMIYEIAHQMTVLQCLKITRFKIFWLAFVSPYPPCAYPIVVCTQLSNTTDISRAMFIGEGSIKGKTEVAHLVYACACRNAVVSSSISKNALIIRLQLILIWMCTIQCGFLEHSALLGSLPTCLPTVLQLYQTSLILCP